MHCGGQLCMLLYNALNNGLASVRCNEANLADPHFRQVSPLLLFLSNGTSTDKCSE